MITNTNTVFTTLKLVLQAESPIAIYSGGRETGFDNELARDANGLPYIPATSFAGVWRHLVTQMCGAQLAREWFGRADSNEEGLVNSQVSIADGKVHDSSNRPVVELVAQSKLEKDALLALLLQSNPHHRERVRINDRGVAADAGKFDQILLPKGTRFTVNLRWSNQGGVQGSDIDKILACLYSPFFTLGSSTRNGLGQVAVIASKKEIFDLSKGAGMSAKIVRARKDKATPNRLEVSYAGEEPQLLASLPLKALDNWRCGSGATLLTDGAGGQKAAVAQSKEHNVNILTYTERAIVWKSEHGRQLADLQQAPQPVFCGSSIKGIIAHRVAFHLRRFTGQWAEDMCEANHDQWQAKPEELACLFGNADENDKAKNRAGKLIFSDSAIRYTQTVTRIHNSIDRFTGGVRQGALYSEQLLYQPAFEVRILAQPGIEISAPLKKAVLATFDDIKWGLLPMGAGSGRGNSLVVADASKTWRVNPNVLICKTSIEKSGETTL